MTRPPRADAMPRCQRYPDSSRSDRSGQVGFYDLFHGQWHAEQPFGHGVGVPSGSTHACWMGKPHGSPYCTL